MKKIISFISIAILSFFLIGCTQSKPNEKMFEVGIDDINDIKLNQEFEITGYLKNNSKYKWGINHGSGMFTYEIFDSEGNPVRQENNILFRNDVGYLHEIKPKDIYRNNGQDQRSKEYYEFVIDKPGNYTVKSKAEFWIQNEENKKAELIIYSDPFEFIVK
jgi:hypothetical protein